jgi:hypothetical protein
VKLDTVRKPRAAEVNNRHGSTRSHAPVPPAETNTTTYEVRRFCWSWSLVAELVGIPRLLSALAFGRRRLGHPTHGLWQVSTNQVYGVGRLRQNCAINEDTKSARARYYWWSGCYPELRHPVNPGLGHSLLSWRMTLGSPDPP